MTIAKGDSMGKQAATDGADARGDPAASALSRVATDWERIECDFRAGLLSVREIAAAHGVSHPAILKRAKRDGWDRDLSAQIKAKADALVTKQTVTAQVTAERKVTDQQIIDGAAQAIVSVRLSHRTDIARSRSLCMALLGELESQTGNMPGLVELGEILRQPNENGADRLNDIYRAVISLPERSKTMKALAESLKGLVSMEREAWGLAAADGAPPPADPAASMPANEAARRIAFALHKGLIATQKGVA